MNEARTLASAKRAVMVAPAGCGKTFTIARAVAEYGTGRDLILTHTNAGVEALRLKLRALGAQSRTYRVETIASWTLRLAAAFPKTSGLPVAMPRTNDDYTHVYTAAQQLLESRSIREIIRSSYNSVYIDEYQDCSLKQHSVVLALAELLPCRVVGDPLQGIFNFPNCPTVDWVSDVEKEFTGLPGPSEPRRWSKTNPELGEWLATVRGQLAANPPLAIDLADSPCAVHVGTSADAVRSYQLSCCHGAADDSSCAVVAIHAIDRQCHDVARRLGGRYSCIEPIESPELTQFAARIDGASGGARAVHVLDFAATCMTKVKTELAAARNAFATGRSPRMRKHLRQVESLVNVTQDASLASVKAALEALAGIDGCSVYRRELLHGMKKAIDCVCAGETASLADAVWIVRNRTRRRGRILPRCAVGTTLLVKGLEFDQALVLDATALKARNLYVALTRGSRSLTIVCQSGVLTPRAGC